MRLLVCGGREYGDRRGLYIALDNLHLQQKITLLITGGARGADMLAKDWADMRKISTLVLRADWEKHGKAAGPIRNQQMLDDGKPELVVAFPGGRGTADMTRRAEMAGVQVRHL